jgi:DNA-binding CsgD family transcriptional regulator
MTPTTALPDSDLRAVTRLLDNASHDVAGQVVPWALLEDLDRLIQSDGVQMVDVDWAHQTCVAQQYFAAGERGVVRDVRGEDIAPYFWHCRDFLPCSDPVPRGDARHAGRWSDFYTDLELRNTEAYRDYFRPERTCLWVLLPSPPGRARRVMFTRESTLDFTDRDVMLLALLRPHLHEILLDAEHRRSGVPRLSAREWEVLHLAGEGMPNGAIAKRLFISPATVRKHLEHIFDHLGVRSRSQAAAMALPHDPHLRTHA